MKERKKVKNCSNKMKQIAIPKGCQQPRTRSRPRTDFSPFLSASTSSSATEGGPRRCRPPHRRLTFEYSICKNSCSSITTAMDQDCHPSFLSLQEKNHKFPLMELSVPSDGGHRSSVSCREVACADVESITKCAPLDTCDNWNDGEHIADPISSFSSAEALPCTPDKTTFQVADNGAVWIVPGCVVWAKTANNTWWPAEVMGERASTNDKNAGRVLVEFYGIHDHAWIDPEQDLSHFEDCFEERSCNPTKMFQDALKRALHRKQNLTFCKDWDTSPDMLTNCNHEEQSSDKWNTSSSSRVDDDYHDGGRGKRKRKPKMHFDEVIIPIKSKKKGRRLRIMRHLGLIAPPGSPFAPASHERTA